MAIVGQVEELEEVEIAHGADDAALELCCQALLEDVFQILAYHLYLLRAFLKYKKLELGVEIFSALDLDGLLLEWHSVVDITHGELVVDQRRRHLGLQLQVHGSKVLLRLHILTRALILPPTPLTIFLYPKLITISCRLCHHTKHS